MTDDSHSNFIKCGCTFCENRRKPFGESFGVIEQDPIAMPFGPDEKIFWVHCCNDEVEDKNSCVKAGCYKISYNDSLQLYNDVSGVNEDLLGAK